jgi:hypothetical protein
MKQEHPMLEEELMAFTDGQLEGSHAERIGLHLEECSDCAQAVEEARQLSQQLSAWKVEESPETMTKSVSAALESHADRQSSWTRGRILKYSLCGALAAFIFVVFLTLQSPIRRGSYMTDTPALPQGSVGSPPAMPTAPPVPKSQSLPFQASRSSQAGQGHGQQGQVAGRLGTLEAAQEVPSGPMVLRTVQLTLISKNFETARTGIESIVRDAKGYIDRMTVQTNPGTPKSLSAVLRIPAERVDNSLVSLRQLGQPRQESQNSSDISGQYVDLVARLNNSRNTEQRLPALLRERTGNLKDIVEAEGELSRVREEIERMEAQRKSLDNQVQFASVQVEVSEEYHAELQPSVPTTGTRFHNATVEGLDSATEAILGMALAGLSYGPAALVWLAVVALLALTARRLYLSLISRRRLRSAGSL